MDKHFRTILACTLFLGAITSAILLRAWQICDGHFGYPIDDTYIHMAMAKNFALHGVWGVTRYAFSSSTSSPLFTLLLAALYSFTGVHELTPLIVNGLLAIGLIAWCCWVLERAALSGRMVLALVSLLILVVPLYAMTIVGMEHVLHMLLTLVFAHVAALRLSGVSSDSKGRLLDLQLLALTPLLVLARYEGTFLVLAAGLLFLLRGRWRVFAGLGALSALPLGIYALISVNHGWYALPNSLLMKANLPGDSAGGIRRFLSALIAVCVNAPHLPLLLLLVAGLVGLVWRRNRTLWTYSGTGLVMFLAAGTLHLLFARVGWYFRYEAYLVAWGIIVSAICMHEAADGTLPRNWRWAGGCLVVLLLITLGVRTVRSIYLTPRGIRNIYDQQYQTARFVRQYYPAATLVVNDIGAICFLTDAHILDAIGLGNMAPAEARMHGTYSAEWLGNWARSNHATLAIAYPDIQPPKSWALLGKWTIPDRWIVGRPDVNVYGLDPQAVSSLKENLGRFQAELPRGVHWTGR
jgi:hypothetical protein